MLRNIHEIDIAVLAQRVLLVDALGRGELAVIVLLLEGYDEIFIVIVVCELTAMVAVNGTTRDIPLEVRPVSEDLVRGHDYECLQ